MLRFAEAGTVKEKFYLAQKPTENGMLMLIKQLSQNQLNQKLIGYLDKAIRPLVLIMPKIYGYLKAFKVKDEDKDKNNKLMSFHMDEDKLLEKYKSIWTKIEDLSNIELNPLPIYDSR